MASWCAQCGLQLVSDDSLCVHHFCVYGETWSAGNRILCAYLHRNAPGRPGGIQDLPRVPEHERNGDYMDYGDCG